jgi:hypothetical protein
VARSEHLLQEGINISGWAIPYAGMNVLGQPSATHIKVFPESGIAWYRSKLRRVGAMGMQ